MRFNHLVAQSRTIGNKYLELFFTFFLILIQQLLVRIQTGFALCLSRLWSHANPIQLAFERFATLARLFLFLLHSTRFLFEPRGVISFPRNAFASVELENPSSHMIEKIAIVRNADHRSFVLLQMLFEPIDRLGIEVVGGLVEQQHIGLLQQQPTQCHTATFASRKLRYGLIFGRTSQCIHRTLEAIIDIPCIYGIQLVLQFGLSGKKLIHLVLVFVIFGQSEFQIDIFVFFQQIHYRLHAFAHHVYHRFVGIEFWVLFEIAHRKTFVGDYLALIFLVDAGNDLQ